MFLTLNFASFYCLLQVCNLAANIPSNPHAVLLVYKHLFVFSHRNCLDSKVGHMQIGITLRAFVGM